VGARSKRQRISKVAEDFDVARLSQRLMLPRDGRNTIDAWNLDMIFAARDEQMLGQFVRPSRMVEQMRTDDALFVAYRSRLAPQSLVPVEMEAAHGARGASIADESDASFGPNGVAISAETIQDIHGCLVNHGVAFGACTMTPREDGSRVDAEMHYWPIEYIRWDPVFRVFKARADPNTVEPGDIPNSPYNEYGFVGGYWIPVVHGDGRWVIFKDHEIEPFRQNAAILPASLVWARHAFGKADWAKGSRAHGSAKVVGELPAGVPLQAPGGGGKLTEEASAFIELLRSIATADAPAGIRPAGSKTDFLTNNSTAWQVWSELVLGEERAAARVYLGTDGTLGAQGGAPGVDITALFGVASKLVNADLKTISRGINTGVIAPWTAINFGTSELAPKRRYILPNDDREKVAKNYSDRNAAFFAALVAAKQAGLELTAEYISKLADDYRVRSPMPTAAPISIATNETQAPKANRARR
jgi:hypothetical protein